VRTTLGWYDSVKSKFP